MASDKGKTPTKSTIVSGAGTSSGTAGAGGSADDTDTVGTSRASHAAGGPVGSSDSTPGGNVTGASGGTTGGTNEAAESSTSLGVGDERE